MSIEAFWIVLAYVLTVIVLGTAAFAGVMLNWWPDDEDYWDEPHNEDMDGDDYFYGDTHQDEP